MRTAEIPILTRLGLRDHMQDISMRSFYGELRRKISETLPEEYAERWPTVSDDNYPSIFEMSQRLTISEQLKMAIKAAEAIGVPNAQNVASEIIRISSIDYQTAPQSEKGTDFLQDRLHVFLTNIGLHNTTMPIIVEDETTRFREGTNPYIGIGIDHLTHMIVDALDEKGVSLELRGIVYEAARSAGWYKDGAGMINGNFHTAELSALDTQFIMCQEEMEPIKNPFSAIFDIIEAGYKPMGSDSQGFYIKPNRKFTSSIGVEIEG